MPGRKNDKDSQRSARYISVINLLSADRLVQIVEKCLLSTSKRAEGLANGTLTNAFRGELVPTEAELARREDRSYEPASSLLARIKADRDIASPPVSKKQKRRL